MFPFKVVINLNILEYGRQGVLRALKTHMMDQFRFYNAKERLGDSVVPAVPHATHALYERMLVQQLPEIMASILNSPIRMNDQTGVGTPIPDGATQGCLHHLAVQRTAERPSDDHPRKQVQKHRQIEPTAFGGDVTDVRYPHRVRSTGRKITLKKVSSDRVRMFRISRRPEFAADNRTQPGRFHPPGYAVFTDRKAIIAQSSVIFGLPLRPLCFM